MAYSVHNACIVQSALVVNKDLTMSERLNLTVDDGVGELLTALAGSERKRGQWVSELARTMYEQDQQIGASDLEEIRISFSGLVAHNKMLENRVAHLERRLMTVEARQNVGCSE